MYFPSCPLSAFSLWELGPAISEVKAESEFQGKSCKEIRTVIRKENKVVGFFYFVPYINTQMKELLFEPLEASTFRQFLYLILE